MTAHRRSLSFALVLALACLVAPPLAAQSYGGGTRLYVKTVTISAGQSLSPAIDLGQATLVQITTPSSWTAANLTFQSSQDGTAFSDLYDDAGNEITVTAAASRAITVSPADYTSIRYLKVRSGTGSNAVAQAADRVITLVLRPY